MRHVYTVTYFFKNERDEFKFATNMDNHITIKYLSKKNNVKALDCEEISDPKTNKSGVEFYFKLKKDAVVFSKYLSIPVSHITKEEYDYDDPWLPPGMTYDDCMDIYGDIPGNRG